MRLLAGLVLLAGGARASELSSCGACSATPPDDQTLLSCRSSGDPHYVTWDATRFDSMGMGVYRMASVTTACGCSVEVQSRWCRRQVCGAQPDTHEHPT